MRKNVLVTGVSQGLGLAVAQAVVGAGWNVYGVSRRLSAEFAGLQEANPGRVFFRAQDLGACGTHEAAFEALVPYDVPLHGVVNNAALAYDDLVTNLDPSKLRAMYEVNVFTPMMLTKRAIRNMLLHGVGGSLVFISSVSAHTGYKGLAMYASTKGALEVFSLNVAREWGERGIRANCVAAGFMETAMSESLTDEQREKIRRRTSLRTSTSPESVAATVVHLLGDGAASITGQTVRVDAGAT